MYYYCCIKINLSMSPRNKFNLIITYMKRYICVIRLAPWEIPTQIYVADIVILEKYVPKCSQDPNLNDVYACSVL